MAVSIELNREFGLHAVEVDTVRSNAVLAAKPVSAQLSPAQSRPQEHLGRRHLLPQLSPEVLLGESVEVLLTIISTVPMLHRHGAYTNPQGLVVMKKPVGVTDAELAVLKVLWARGPLAARAITQAVYPDGAESEFAAVHSFLQRLERKGLVARDRRSFVHIFSATASPADVLGQELESLVERLGGDSIAPLIMQLIDQKRLSSKEAAAIRKRLGEYSQ
jgi:predicted transcriptional regulator